MNTLADLLPTFLADMESRLRPNTLGTYRTDLTAAVAQLHVSLDQVTLSTIESLFAHGKAIAVTANQRASSLRRFFRWAIRHEYSVTNPLDWLEPQRTMQRLPRPICITNDIQTLEAAIGKAPQHYRLILLLLRETGMRVGEVLALNLTIATLAVGHKGLWIRGPKNGHERIVILHPDATPESLRRQPAHVPLFRFWYDTQVSYDAVQYQWTQLYRAIGLVKGDRLHYIIHQLRHTLGSELVRQGQSMEIVQRMLHHCDICSTLGYAKLDDQQVWEVLSK